MIQWNADLARRLQCREEEKKALGPIIQRLMDLDRKARDEGFLALEAELASIDDPLLAVGVRLVMEGVSGEALEEILATYLLVEDARAGPSSRPASRSKACSPSPNPTIPPSWLASSCPISAPIRPSPPSRRSRGPKRRRDEVIEAIARASRESLELRKVSRQKKDALFDLAVRIGALADQARGSSSALARAAASERRKPLKAGLELAAAGARRGDAGSQTRGRGPEAAAPIRAPSSNGCSCARAFAASRPSSTTASSCGE